MRVKPGVFALRRVGDATIKDGLNDKSARSRRSRGRGRGRIRGRESSRRPHLRAQRCLGREGGGEWEEDESRRRRAR